jgi:hypothetical protein
MVPKISFENINEKSTRKRQEKQFFATKDTLLATRISFCSYAAP